MAGEDERTAVIATTRTAFEADTIAQALRASGFDARVVGAASSMVWSGAGSEFAPVRVIVLEHEAAGARAALSQIRFEGQSIDWDAVDVGEPVDLPLMSRWNRTRRVMWTLALAVLPPIGIFVMILGVSRAEPLLQVMGGTVLACAMVMAGLLAFPAREGGGR